MNGIETMQITHHTDNQIEKTNVPRFLQTMKALAPRSYDKAFNGMDEEVVIFAMSKAIDGLSKQQLQVGLDAMFEQGYCPDPIMFRKWCLGIKGIGDGANPIQASYRSKNAALANIEAWLCDSTTKITNAEKEAYNRCYGMFNDLKWNYSDKQKFHTYLAFKDFYDEVVKELVAKGESQSIWIEPPVIEDKSKLLLTYGICYSKSDFNEGEYVYHGGIINKEQHEFKFSKKEVFDFSRLNNISYDEAERKIISRELKIIRDKQLADN